MSDEATFTIQILLDESGGAGPAPEDEAPQPQPNRVPPAPPASAPSVAQLMGQAPMPSHEPAPHPPVSERPKVAPAAAEVAPQRAASAAQVVEPSRAEPAPAPAPTAKAPEAAPVPSEKPEAPEPSGLKPIGPPPQAPPVKDSVDEQPAPKTPEAEPVALPPPEAPPLALVRQTPEGPRLVVQAAGAPVGPGPAAPIAVGAENKASAWVPPDLEEEAEELSRTEEDQGFKKGTLRQAFKQAQLQPLTDDLWSRMENTDSWNVKSMEDAQKLATEYGRDLGRISKGLEAAQDMPAPLVLIKPDGAPYLVGGNTRLMAARASGVRPDVMVADMATPSTQEAEAEQVAQATASIQPSAQGPLDPLDAGWPKDWLQLESERERPAEPPPAPELDYFDLPQDFEPPAIPASPAPPEQEVEPEPSDDEAADEPESQPAWTSYFPHASDLPQAPAPPAAPEAPELGYFDLPQDFESPVEQQSPVEQAQPPALAQPKPTEPAQPPALAQPKPTEPAQPPKEESAASPPLATPGDELPNVLSERRFNRPKIPADEAGSARRVKRRRSKREATYPRLAAPTTPRSPQPPPRIEQQALPEPVVAPLPEPEPATAPPPAPLLAPELSDQAKQWKASLIEVGIDPADLADMSERDLHAEANVRGLLQPMAATPTEPEPSSTPEPEATPPPEEIEAPEQSGPLFLGDNAAVIPVVHGQDIDLAEDDRQRLAQIADTHGFYHEGVGEGGIGGEGHEREFTRKLGVPEAKNRGSYDDQLSLGKHAGYTLFANLKSNKENAEKVAKLPGETVSDVLYQALTQGIGTFQGQKLSPIHAKELLEIAKSDGLDITQPRDRVLDVLEEGENRMWAGGNPDESSKSPLGQHAYEAGNLRRENVKRIAKSGALLFMGSSHLPALAQKQQAAASEPTPQGPPRLDESAAETAPPPATGPVPAEQTQEPPVEPTPALQQEAAEPPPAPQPAPAPPPDVAPAVAEMTPAEAAGHDVEAAPAPEGTPVPKAPAAEAEAEPRTDQEREPAPPPKPPQVMTTREADALDKTYGPGTAKQLIDAGQAVMADEDTAPAPAQRKPGRSRREQTPTAPEEYADLEPQAKAPPPQKPTDGAAAAGEQPGFPVPLPVQVVNWPAAPAPAAAPTATAPPATAERLEQPTETIRPPAETMAAAERTTEHETEDAPEPTQAATAAPAVTPSPSPAPPPSAPTAGIEAEIAARKQMEAERQREEIDKARRLIDPDYDARRTLNERQRERLDAQEAERQRRERISPAEREIEDEQRMKDIDTARRRIDPKYNERRRQEEDEAEERKFRKAADAERQERLETPEGRAEAQIESEQRGNAVETARRQIDPDYDKQRREEEEDEARRKARAEQLATPEGRARAQVEAKQRAEEDDKARREIDPEHDRKRREEEDSERRRKDPAYNRQRQAEEDLARRHEDEEYDRRRHQEESRPNKGFVSRAREAYSYYERQGSRLAEGVKKQFGRARDHFDRMGEAETRRLQEKYGPDKEEEELRRLWEKDNGKPEGWADRKDQDEEEQGRGPREPPKSKRTKPSPRPSEAAIEPAPEPPPVTAAPRAPRGSVYDVAAPEAPKPPPKTPAPTGETYDVVPQPGEPPPTYNLAPEPAPPAPPVTPKATGAASAGSPPPKPPPVTGAAGAAGEAEAGAGTGAAGGAAATAGAAAGAFGLAVMLAAEAIKAEINAVSVMYNAANVGLKFSGDALIVSIAEIAKKVPVFGEAVGGLMQTLVGLHLQVEQTLNRFAKWSGPLSMQQGQEEVRQIQREMNRAQKFGPEFSNLATARTEANTKLDNLVDRMAPLFLKLAESAMVILGKLADMVGDYVKNFAEVMTPLLQYIATASLTPAAVADRMNVVIGILERMAHPADIGGGVDFGIQQMRDLFGSGSTPAARERRLGPAFGL